MSVEKPSGLEEFHDFFERGELGAEDALSDASVESTDLESEGFGPLPPSEEQAARRARYARIVSYVMAGLSALAAFTSVKRVMGPSALADGGEVGIARHVRGLAPEAQARPLRVAPLSATVDSAASNLALLGSEEQAACEPPSERARVAECAPRLQGGSAQSALSGVSTDAVQELEEVSIVEPAPAVPPAVVSPTLAEPEASSTPSEVAPALPAKTTASKLDSRGEKGRAPQPTRGHSASVNPIKGAAGRATTLRRPALPLPTAASFPSQ